MNVPLDPLIVNADQAPAFTCDARALGAALVTFTTILRGGVVVKVEEPELPPAPHAKRTASMHVVRTLK